MKKFRLFGFYLFVVLVLPITAFDFWNYVFLEALPPHFPSVIHNSNKCLQNACCVLRGREYTTRKDKNPCPWEAYTPVERHKMKK